MTATLLVLIFSFFNFIILSFYHFFMEKYISPQQQLWKMLTDIQREELGEILRRLKKRDQEALCYGVIAFIKFGIRRPFESKFMQLIFNTMILLIVSKDF